MEDMLGIGGHKPFRPYKIKGGWTVVTLGAESGRRQAQGKIVRALSKVEISLRSAADVQTCIRHLEESDRRFAEMRSTSWDWQRVIFKGLKVRFAVEWYDRAFFSEKKNAYLTPDHARMYEHFGATVDDINVRHFYIDDAGNEEPVA